MGAANREARRSESPMIEMLGKFLDKTSMKGIGNTKPENLEVHKPATAEKTSLPSKKPEDTGPQSNPLVDKILEQQGAPMR